jgi:hypothetical protein
VCPFAPKLLQGNRDTKNDLRLAIPMLFLSRAIIFNVMGIPNRQTVLDALQLLHQGALAVKRRYCALTRSHAMTLPKA